MNWKGYFISARPKTLFASMGPVLIGGAVSYPSEKFWLFPFVLVCAILMQIGSNLINDYYDSKDGVDSSKRLGPKRAIHLDLITLDELKNFILLTFGAAFLIGVFISYFVGLKLFILGLICLSFAFLYTGGPFPLSRLGLGEIAAFIFFGPIAVCGTQFILKGYFSLDALAFSLVPGFFSSFIMGINNLRDRNEDKKSGKITIASLLSERFARSFTITLMVMAFFILFNLSWYYKGGSYLSIGSLTILVFWKSLKRIISSPLNAELNESLADAGKILAINSLIISIVILINDWSF